MDENLKRSLETAGKIYVAALTKELLSAGKKESGQLIKSLDYDVVETIDGLSVYIIGKEYLEQVDQGRKKGKMPPVKAIQKWVKGRGIKFKGQTEESTAFIIARSIAKKGIRPTNVINKTKNRVLNNISEIIAAGYIEDLAATIDQALKDIN